MDQKYPNPPPSGCAIFREVLERLEAGSRQWLSPWLRSPKTQTATATVAFGFPGLGSQLPAPLWPPRPRGHPRWQPRTALCGLQQRRAHKAPMPKEPEMHLHRCSGSTNRRSLKKQRRAWLPRVWKASHPRAHFSTKMLVVPSQLKAKA